MDNEEDDYNISNVIQCSKCDNIIKNQNDVIVDNDILICFECYMDEITKTIID